MKNKNTEQDTEIKWLNFNGKCDLKIGVYCNKSWVVSIKGNTTHLIYNQPCFHLLPLLERPSINFGLQFAQNIPTTEIDRLIQELRNHILTAALAYPGSTYWAELSISHIETLIEKENTIPAETINILKKALDERKLDQKNKHRAMRILKKVKS